MLQVALLIAMPSGVTGAGPTQVFSYASDEYVTKAIVNPILGGAAYTVALEITRNEIDPDTGAFYEIHKVVAFGFTGDFEPIGDVFETDSYPGVRLLAAVPAESGDRTVLVYEGLNQDLLELQEQFVEPKDRVLRFSTTLTSYSPYDTSFHAYSIFDPPWVGKSPGSDSSGYRVLDAGGRFATDRLGNDTIALLVEYAHPVGPDKETEFKLELMRVDARTLTILDETITPVAGPTGLVYLPYGAQGYYHARTNQAAYDLRDGWVVVLGDGSSYAARAYDDQLGLAAPPRIVDTVDPGQSPLNFVVAGGKPDGQPGQYALATLELSPDNVTGMIDVTPFAIDGSVRPGPTRALGPSSLKSPALAQNHASLSHFALLDESTQSNSYWRPGQPRFRRLGYSGLAFDQFEMYWYGIVLPDSPAENFSVTYGHRQDEAVYVFSSEVYPYHDIWAGRYAPETDPVSLEGWSTTLQIGPTVDRRGGFLNTQPGTPLLGNSKFTITLEGPPVADVTLEVSSARETAPDGTRRPKMTAAGARTYTATTDFSGQASQVVPLSEAVPGVNDPWFARIFPTGGLRPDYLENGTVKAVDHLYAQWVWVEEVIVGACEEILASDLPPEVIGELEPCTVEVEIHRSELLKIPLR